MKIFIYWGELTFRGKEIKIWWRAGGGNERIFDWWGQGLPTHLSSRENHALSNC